MYQSVTCNLNQKHSLKNQRILITTDLQLDLTTSSKEINFVVEKLNTQKEVEDNLESGYFNQIITTMPLNLITIKEDIVRR